MKKNSLKKFSLKLRAFYWALISILSCIIMNAFTMKSENVFIAALWGIVTLYGIFAGGKVADDWQRGLNFKKDLYEGGQGC